jgi:hypothetical protein
MQHVSPFLATPNNCAGIAVNQDNDSRQGFPRAHMRTLWRPKRSVPLGVVVLRISGLTYGHSGTP